MIVKSLNCKRLFSKRNNNRRNLLFNLRMKFTFSLHSKGLSIAESNRVDDDDNVLIGRIER